MQVPRPISIVPRDAKHSWTMFGALTCLLALVSAACYCLGDHVAMRCHERQLRCAATTYSIYMLVLCYMLHCTCSHDGNVLCADGLLLLLLLLLVYHDVMP